MCVCISVGIYMPCGVIRWTLVYFGVYTDRLSQGCGQVPVHGLVLKYNFVST